MVILENVFSCCLQRGLGSGMELPCSRLCHTKIQSQTSELEDLWTSLLSISFPREGL